VALTTSDIHGLSTSQIAAFTTDSFAAFTTAQIHEFSTSQVAALTTDQIVAFETQDLSALSLTQAMAFTTAQVAHMSGAQLDALIASTPVVLDLNGDGIQTVSAAHGNQFDLNATGATTQHGWVARTDGLLAMDRNHDGIINNGTELFGSATILSNGQRAGNGYNAMADLDSNHDGKLTAADAHFKDLKVWVDANGNGISDAGELIDLSKLGIIEIDLHAQATTQLNNGNAAGLVSNYKTSDGHTHEVADVWFSKDTNAAGSTASPTTNGTPAASGTATATTDPATTPDAHTAATSTVAKASTHGTLGVSASDVLADPGQDLLPGGPDEAKAAALHAASAVAPVSPEVHLSTIDPTQLLQENKNNPLI
jgi:hypothetical protein